MDDEQEPRDVLEQLESELLGNRRFTRLEVAERAGVPLERAVRLWRALGFASVADDERVFGDQDVRALELIGGLVERGVGSTQLESQWARALGLSLARLADWQTAVLGDLARQDETQVLGSARALVPVMEELQSYVWRRHLLAATGRLLSVSSEDPTSTTLVVGFADIVGFTGRSRHVDEVELGDLVDSFEGTASGIVAEHNGRVVKMIGDEVLFVCDAPAQGADVALALLAWASTAPDRLPLRIGLAHGTVLSRLGDVYGPVVNIAARLTSLARPASVLVDRSLAEALRDEPAYRLSRTRHAAVRGYPHLQPWALTSST